MLIQEDQKLFELSTWILICLAGIAGIYFGNRSKRHPFFNVDTVIGNEGNVTTYYLFWEFVKIEIFRKHI